MAARRPRRVVATKRITFGSADKGWVVLPNLPAKTKSRALRLFSPVKRRFASGSGATLGVSGRGGRRAIITLANGSQLVFICKRISTADGFRFVVLKEDPSATAPDPTYEKPTTKPRHEDYVILREFRDVLVKRFRWPPGFF